jgi:hypothetical protein
MLKPLKMCLHSTIGATAAALLAWSASAQESRPQAFPGYMDFKGRYLAVLSDADMVASAYLDDDLGPRSPLMRDELALIPLDGGLPGETRRIPVSNAVTAWPSCSLSPRTGALPTLLRRTRPRRPGPLAVRTSSPAQWSV